MSQRIDVFISSTSLDLPEHREQAKDACLRMDMFPIMMENLPASDAGAIEKSLNMVNEAEIYLGIFAWRYGHIPKGHDISITEMEYNRAVERDIPRLIFVMHDDHPVKAADVEKEGGAVKLEALKQRLLSDQIVNFFKSPEDLRARIIHSLGQIPGFSPSRRLQHYSRYTTEVALPPEPYIAHPYTFLQTKDLIGRQKELNTLTAWATGSRPELLPVRLFSFVSIGGMGKSALTWKWFNDILPQEMKPLAGRLWWSFYESDADFENFVSHTLAYVSSRSVEDIERNVEPTQREKLLLAELDRKPYFLVLDGLERILIAYTDLEAHYLNLPDENIEAFASGLSKSFSASSKDSEHQDSSILRLRKTIEPRAGLFLQKLALVKASRVLLSTRLFPADLETVSGYPLPSCFMYELQGLDDDDAVNLWREFGVTGSRDELLRLFHHLGNYPLLIRALAWEVAHFRWAPGSFDKWREANPDFNPYILDLKQVKTHVLAYALRGLSETEENLLNIVAAFHMPVAYDVLVSLFVGEGRSLAYEHELDKLLSSMENRGLLGWNRISNRYDIHPVTRGVIWTALEKVKQDEIYETVCRYCSKVVLENPKKVARSMDDLTPEIEWYYALVELGRLDEALVVFETHLEFSLMHRFGASSLQTSLLELLFPDGIDALPQLGSEKSQAAALSKLAQSYLLSGQPSRAIRIYPRASRLLLQAGDWYIDGHLCNLAEAQVLTGQLQRAETSARSALTIARRIGSPFAEAESLRYLGSILSVEGRLDEAQSAFLRALRILSSRDKKMLHRRSQHRPVHISSTREETYQLLWKFWQSRDIGQCNYWREFPNWLTKENPVQDDEKTKLYRLTLDFLREYKNKEVLDDWISALKPSIDKDSDFRVIHDIKLLTDDWPDKSIRNYWFIFWQDTEKNVSDSAMGREIEDLEKTFRDGGFERAEGVVNLYYAQWHIYKGDYSGALALANRAWELANSWSSERDFIRAARMQGISALKLGDWETAESRLHHALVRARAASIVQEEIPALIAFAELEYLRGDLESAQQEYLYPTWELLHRSPCPLFAADAYNILAGIREATGDSDIAIEAATEAYKSAWCAGPPFVYQWGLDSACFHLDRLGVSYPDLPVVARTNQPGVVELEIDPPDEFGPPDQ